MNTMAISTLFKGLAILNLILLPLTLLLTFFVATMGAGGPNSPGFLRSFAMTSGFIYGTQLCVLIGLVTLGKVFDFILRLVPMATMEVSWIAILIAAILLVVLGNIFVDNLYQFKQGNYGLSFIALFMILAYVVVVYFSARISIPWISK